MTSTILPEYILRLFEKEINDIVFKVVKKLCDEYDIDIEEAKELATVNLKLKTDDLRIIKKNVPHHPQDIRCEARMLHEVEIKQCSRKKFENGLCGQHLRMLREGRLKYGKISDPVPLELNQKVLDHKKKGKLY